LCQQHSKDYYDRLCYILADNSIYGFSNPSAGILTPLTGNFPIGVSSSSHDSDIAVAGRLALIVHLGLRYRSYGERPRVAVA
jgi:hypothetical protein